MKDRRACAVVILAALLACRAEPPPPERVIRPVRWQQVAPTSGERAWVFSGVAQASVESHLSFRVPGTLRRVAVNVGSAVEQGDLIAALDPEDYQLALEKARAALTEARAQERNAEANYERVRQLYENRNASRNDLDTARAAYESAAASVQAFTTQLELARRQLEDTALRSPLDGRIADVAVEVNENVVSGRPVATLNAGEAPEMQVAIPDTLVTRVDEGQTVSVTFDALPDVELAAVVTEVGVARPGAGSTFPVTVRLVEGHAEVRPGMAANVTFRLPQRGGGERIYVPPVAVGEDRAGRFVFVLEAADEPGLGTARRREVNVGDLTEHGVEIRDGLEAGERVVTAGVRRIHDGQVVRVGEGAGREG